MVYKHEFRAEEGQRCVLLRCYAEANPLYHQRSDVCTHDMALDPDNDPQLSEDQRDFVKKVKRSSDTILHLTSLFVSMSCCSSDVEWFAPVGSGTIEDIFNEMKELFRENVDEYIEAIGGSG